MISITPFTAVFVAAYITMVVIDAALELLNAFHLKRRSGKVPEGFSDLLDPGFLKRMEAYSVSRTKLGLVETFSGRVLFLGILLSGLLPAFQETLAGLGMLAGGLVFFAALGGCALLFDLPFGWVRVFSIEEKFGFNTRSVGLWVRDILKSSILSLILGGGLLTLVLLVMRQGGEHWWVWAWGVFFFFQVFVFFLYPVLIAPLFNTFTPMEDHPLAARIRDLGEREGLRVKGVFRMDAGKRSRHSNAYLAGLGRTRRIVLFDTLLETHGDDEILAVLAHEIGHLKKRHLLKHLVLTGAASGLLLYFAAIAMTWDGMYEAFGFSSETAYVGLLLVGILYEPLAFFLSPFPMALSRRFEREADAYGSALMADPEPLIEALRKMVRHNLSNLFPHPVYVLFHYSHPPVPERIALLRRSSP